MEDTNVSEATTGLLALGANLMSGFVAVTKNDGKLLRRMRESDVFLGSLLAMSLTMLFALPVSQLDLPRYTLVLLRDWLEEIETVAADEEYDEQRFEAIRGKLREIEAELQQADG